MECPVVLEQMWWLSKIVLSDVVSTSYNKLKNKRTYISVSFHIWLWFIWIPTRNWFQSSGDVCFLVPVILTSIPSHACAHSAPPFSCPEGDFTLSSQASVINGKISNSPLTVNVPGFLLFHLGCSLFSVSM